MSISALIPVAVLVLASMAATPESAPAGAVVADCVLVTVAGGGQDTSVKICPPNLPPFPPM